MNNTGAIRDIRRQFKHSVQDYFAMDLSDGRRKCSIAMLLANGNPVRIHRGDYVLQGRLHATGESRVDMKLTCSCNLLLHWAGGARARRDPSASWKTLRRAVSRKATASLRC